MTYLSPRTHMHRTRILLEKWPLPMPSTGAPVARLLQRPLWAEGRNAIEAQRTCSEGQVCPPGRELGSPSLDAGTKLDLSFL